MAATLDPKNKTNTGNAVTTAVQAAKPVTMPTLPFQQSKASLAPTVQKSATVVSTPNATVAATSAPKVTAPDTSAPTNSQNNWNALNNNSDYLASEIARAQQVKADRAAKGLATTDQDNYLTKLTGISAGTPYVPGTGATAGASGTTSNGLGLPPELSWLNASGDAEVNEQINSYNQRQEAAKLAAQFGIDQNNQYLKDQIAAMQSQRAVDMDALQQQQNRFGGLYSGGLNYQGGQINNSYAQQQGQLSRDIASRNQQLLDQYGTQANTIAQQIQQLQSNQPGIIRDRINDYLTQYASQYGYNPLNPNQSTLQGKQANLDAALQVGNQTGYNVSPQNDWQGLYRQTAQGTDAMGNPLTQNLSGQQFASNEDQRAIDNSYRQQQADIDNAYQQGQLSLQQAQEARMQLQQDYDEAYRRYGIQNGTGSGASEYNGLTPNQVLDSIQSQFKDDSGKIPAGNKQAVYEAIIDAGLTDEQTDQLLAVSGLTKKEIEAFNKQYGVGK